MGLRVFFCFWVAPYSDSSRSQGYGLTCLYALLRVCCVGCQLAVNLLIDVGCMLAMMVTPLGQGQDEGKTARFADMHVDIGMDLHMTRYAEHTDASRV